MKLFVPFHPTLLLPPWRPPVPFPLYVTLFHGRVSHFFRIVSDSSTKISAFRAIKGDFHIINLGRVEGMAATGLHSCIYYARRFHLLFSQNQQHKCNKSDTCKGTQMHTGTVNSTALTLRAHAQTSTQMQTHRRGRCKHGNHSHDLMRKFPVPEDLIRLQGLRARLPAFMFGLLAFYHGLCASRLRCILNTGLA